ncbi:MAG: type II toxin-antitoxin system VapC family toxin [SAR324 cluster bacterium]|nr:type II toxin-antitoxin system VapC family toxin [SAR324 cluster bacterium]
MAETNIRNIYWDACCWISLINEEADWGKRCEYLIEQAKEEKVRIWTSTISYAEVYKKKIDGKIAQISEEKDRNFEEYLGQDFIVLIQVDQQVGLEARRLLRGNQGLNKPNDAIHLASAILNNLDEFHTFDNKDLLPLNGLIKRSDGENLLICEPPVPSNQQAHFYLSS